MVSTALCVMTLVFKMAKVVFAAAVRVTIFFAANPALPRTRGCRRPISSNSREAT